MLSLVNCIFTKGKLLQKRNGFQQLTSLPMGASATTLTTFNGNLTAIGMNLFAYNESSSQWANKGITRSISLSVEPIVRTSSSQVAPDIAVAGTLCCAVFKDGDGNYKYTILDPLTGQSLIGITFLPNTSSQARVFVLGNYFVITFLVNVGGTPHLQYIAIPLTNISSPFAPRDLSTQVSSLTAGYDGFVSGGMLYIAWDGSDVGNAIRVTRLDLNLIQHNTVAIPTYSSQYMSVTVDSTQSTAVVWVTFYNGSSHNTYTTALNQNLLTILAPTLLVSSTVITELTSVAQNMLMTAFYQVTNSYSYAAIRTDYISSNTCTQAGVVGTPVIVVRSVGLGSKSFLYKTVPYLVASYGGTFQPTYFLLDSQGNVLAKYAYSNGGGYYTTQVLPSVTLTGDIAQVGYLFKDLLQPVNKSVNPASSSSIYSQTGVNLITFNLNSTNLVTSEIGSNLQVAGGILWAYDGVKPVEQDFNVWPEDIAATTSVSGGFLTAQQYFYQVTYEWTDAQGNLHRSAPSIPLAVITTGSTSSNTLNIPTLRLTYKITPNIVRIVIYRWSTSQQEFFQITSITSPLLNDTTVDSVTYVDTQADFSIVGNELIYTTGGVVENIAPTATGIISLYKNRLFLVDAEDPNLLWYSKQVIENTPVEMSDLFTLFVAPTSGAQGSTGAVTALAPLDDKLIIFKRDAIYYITGNGPDNTGANNDFSDPIFITATVGCSNPHSIVFSPQGLMFESDKGKWLLGRNLNTSYIGAPVEAFNANLVLSSLNVPGTNQVRLTLSNNITLMYDYYYEQWGQFSGIPALSSTLYKELHTFLNSFGQVYQELPGTYMDGPNPVLMSFTTAWMNLAGLQGYERAYFFYLLGQYYSPHFLGVSISYDYNPSPSQEVIIAPTNYAPPYGDVLNGNYGQLGPYGGPGNVEQWRIFLKRQKCQAFQIALNETFDRSFGTLPGAGLSFSGLNLVVGAKKAYKPQKAAESIG
jgi:hypothetical protein